jgi:hypothetical protein
MYAETIQQVLKLAIPAGLLAGALTGLIARIAMRIFALISDETPRFSILGTIGVIAVFAVVLGIPLGVIYVRFWPASGMVAGLLYGLMIFLILIALPFLLIPDDDATLRLRFTAMAAFLPVPLIYGYTLAALTGRLADLL